MQGDLHLGGVAVEYDFMVPVYHDVAGEISLEAVSSYGALVLILLVAVVLFRFKLRAPEERGKE